MIKNPVVITLAGFVLFLLLSAFLMYLIEFKAGNSGFDSFFHSLWFAIITVTTVGYGDISPVSRLGQGLTVFIVFAGIGYSGMLTGSITSWLVERNRRKMMGLVPLKGVEGKFMVCGWKPNMRGLLKDILHVTGQQSSDLVLLNQMDPVEVQSLRKDPELEHFYFYSGDDTNLADLKKAGTSVMGTVMVLADTLPGKSDEEIDFKSVVTAHEVEQCNNTAYQIVELNLKKFTPYLKKANVEEVILNRDYSQVLLCNLALMSGLYEVIKAFFSLKQGLLYIQPLASNHKGQTYGQLKAITPDAVVLGLLENMGKISDRKAEYLNQVTSSVLVSSALKGLASFKEFIPNEPILNPPEDYKIKGNSGLLLLRTSPDGLNQQGNIEKQRPTQKGHKKLIRFSLEENLKLCATWKDYVELLQNQGIQACLQETHLTGFSYDQEQYSLEELGLPQELITTLKTVVRSLESLDEEGKGDDLLVAGPARYGKTLRLLQRGHLQNKPGLGPLLVLGWKSGVIEMVHYLIAHQEEPYVQWRGITLVAQVGQQEQTLFEQHFGGHEDVRLVVGEVTSAEVLFEAGLMHSNKVLIIAETGRGKTLEEVDSQSVLACIQVAELNQKAYVTAEFLSKKYLEAMIGTNVEECFLVDEFNNILLANGASGQGMSNVIRDLTNQRDSLLELHPIEHRFIGSPFADLCHKIPQKGQLVLGLLEQVGNRYVRKTELINEAQRQPQRAQAVIMLQEIKQMGTNQVLLAPPSGHLVKPHSRLILLNSSHPALWREGDDERLV